jgi:hypothetical protein
MRHRIGWQSLVDWALGFALLTFAVISAASIGTFVLPFALVALTSAAIRNRSWPESVTGLLTGSGVVCLYVAYWNRDYTPCPPAGVTARVGPGEYGRSERFSCGGFDPVPWFTVGSILVAAAIVGYWVFRRTHRTADEGLVISR